MGSGEHKEVGATMQNVRAIFTLHFPPCDLLRFMWLSPKRTNSFALILLIWRSCHLLYPCKICRYWASYSMPLACIRESLAIARTCQGDTPISAMLTKMGGFLPI